MGRQSARLWYKNKDHKDIYFQGHYHDKMYVGSQLVWEKLPDYDLWPIPDGDLWFYHVPKIIRSNGEVDYYLDYYSPSNSHTFTLIKVYEDGTESSLILEDSDANYYPRKTLYAEDGTVIELFWPQRKENSYNFFYHYKMVDTSTMTIVDSGTVETHDYNPDAYLYNEYYLSDFSHPYSFNLKGSGGVYRTTGGVSLFSYKQGNNVYVNRYIGIMTFNRNLQQNKAYDFLRDIPSKFGKLALDGSYTLTCYKIYEDTGLGINDYLYLINYTSNNNRSLVVFNTGTAEMYPISTIELKYESETIPRLGYAIQIYDEEDSALILSRSNNVYKVLDISQYPFTQIGSYPDFELSADNIGFSLMPSKDSMYVTDWKNGVADPYIQNLSTNKKTTICPYYYYPDDSYLYFASGLANFLDDTHCITACLEYDSSGHSVQRTKNVHLFRLSETKGG